MTGRRIAAFVVVFTLVEHVASIVAERVPPRDLNAAWANLPRHVQAITDGALLDLWVPGAWPQALVATSIVLFGRNAEVFQGVTLLWVALSLIAVGGLTRSVRAVALAAQVPALVLLPRGGWIHSPEAALALVLGWLIVGSRAGEEGGPTSRWSGEVASQGRRAFPSGRVALHVAYCSALAVLGAALVLLRTSGLLWVGVAAVALVARRRRWSTVGVFVVWALAAIPSASGLLGYARGKVGLAERYAATVPDLLPQIAEHLGATGMVVAVACVGWRLRSRWRGGGMGEVVSAPGSTAWKTIRAHPERAVLLGGWLGVPLVTTAVTHVGLDNFPLFFAAIVLLVVGPAVQDPLTTPDGRWTALGVSPSDRVLTAVVLVGWAASVGGRLSMPDAEGPSARERVAALLDSACPSRNGGVGERGSALADDAPRAPGGGTHTCTVIVDQGLYHPFAEDDTLELFLSDEDNVRLVGLHRLARSNTPMSLPEALVTWDCGERNAMWRQRFPANDQDRLRMVRRFGLEVRTRVRAEGCELVWMTP